MNITKSARESMHDTTWDFMGTAWLAVHAMTLLSVFLLGRALGARAIAERVMEEE